MVTIAEVATWLLDSGLLEKTLAGEKKQPDFLTAGEASKLLDEMIRNLVARLDEERLRQLGAGLAQLRDALHSSAPNPLIANALNSFHEIAALSEEGQTGDYHNRKLISLANLGLASIYQLTGDAPELAAEKLTMAVAVDPVTAQQFLGMELTNAIHRRLSPGKQVLYLFERSLSDSQTLFPRDRSYYIPVHTAPYAHLWVGIYRDGERFRISRGWTWLDEQLGCEVGYTLHAALALSELARRYKDDIHIHNVNWSRLLPEPKARLRQGKRAARLKDILQDLPTELKEVALFAPLSGRVKRVNEEMAEYYRFEFPSVLRSEPFEKDWLFAMELDAVSFWTQRTKPKFQREMDILLDAAAYRQWVEDSPECRWALVDSIAYEVKGGKSGDRDLLVDICVVSQVGQPLSGVHVQATLSQEGDSEVATYTMDGKTDERGIIAFIMKKAPPGIYTTTIDAIEAGDRTWIGAAPENRYRK